MKKKIEIYLVGGAIRDNILKLNIVEKDWVIIGSNPQDLLKLNFINVGNSFPVFLHPKSKEEYALARKEKKVSKGYSGFECSYKNNVSLKEDLKRRDLTINAIAQNHEGKYIDPYKGLNDLKNKILRHVSIAFIEDPLRVLRVARLLSKLFHLGFKIHKTLFNLMNKIVISKEIESISFCRILKEIRKALINKNPDIFFKVLKYLNILNIILPGLNYIWKKDINCEKVRKIFYNLYIFRQKTKNSTYIYALLNKNLFFYINKKEFLENLKNNEKKEQAFINIFIYFHLCFNIKLIEESIILYLLNKFYAFKKNKLFMNIMHFLFLVFSKCKKNKYLTLYLKKNHNFSEKNNLFHVKQSIKHHIGKKISMTKINNIYYIKLFFYFNYFK